MFFSLESAGIKLPTGSKNVSAQTRIKTPEARIETPEAISLSWGLRT
jgi:hypothetical protein